MAKPIELNTTAIEFKETPESGGLAIGDPVTGGASGRILFVDAAIQLAQDSNLFWDNPNNRLGIFTTAPAARLSNTTTLLVDALGNTTNPRGIMWGFDGTGYVAGLEQLGGLAANHGLLIRTASAQSGTRLLNLMAGSSDIFEFNANGRFRVNRGTSGVTENTTANSVVVNAGISSGISILTPAANNASIELGNPTLGAAAGIVRLAGATSSFELGGAVSGADVRIQSGSTLSVYIDNTTQNVRIGQTASAGERLEVDGSVSVPDDKLFLLRGPGVLTGLRYNTTSGNVEIVKAGTVVASW